MKAQPVIRLYDLEGLALIVKTRSGVIYTNQAGGVFCMQPKVEGVLVPIEDEGDEIERRLDSWFGSYGRIKAEDVASLNGILHTPKEGLTITPTFFLDVDPSKIKESMEAWLHVRITSCPDEHMVSYHSNENGYSNVQTLSGNRWNPRDQPELRALCHYSFSGFAGYEAVLTWPNSD